MKRRMFISSVIFSFVFLSLYGCGDSTAPTATTSRGSVTSIDQLPKATGPVASASADMMSDRSWDPDYLIEAAASTGLGLQAATNSSFVASNSRGMCEVVNVTKEVIDRASAADRTQCYVQNTMVSATNAAALTAAGINLYDGNYHIFTLNFSNGGNSTNTAPKMKMRIVKSNGTISRFEMYGCMGGTAASPTQSEYILQTITDGAISITSKNVSTSGSNTFSGDTSVTGILDANLKYSSKVIVASSKFTSSSNTNKAKATLTQGSNFITLNGFNSGAMGSSTYSNRFYSKYQLIDLNTSSASYDLSKLYIGDGTVKGILSNSFGGSSWSNTIVDSWYGDTKNVLSDSTAGMYYSEVNPQTPTAVEDVSISFGTDQTWDCTGASEVTITVDQSTLDSKCSTFSMYASGSHDWLNCYSIMGN